MAVYELAYERIREARELPRHPALRIAAADLRVLLKRRALRIATFFLGGTMLLQTAYVAARSGILGDLASWLPIAQLPAIDARFFERAVWNGGHHTLVLLLALFAGSGRIAGDLRSSALALYLSRPLGRRDYLAGKALATAAVVALGALGTPLLVYLSAALADPSFLVANLRTGLALLGIGVAATIYHTSAVLFCSSLVRNGRLAGVLLGGIWFLSGAVSRVTGLAFRTKSTSVLGYRANLDTIATHLFGSAAPDAPGLAPAILVVALVTAAGLGFAWSRVRAVEVVR